jgi:iron complex outermembrane receptor protein
MYVPLGGFEMISNALRWTTSASICLVLIIVAGVQSAQAQTKDFNVPAQSATTGIPEFARQAGIQILVSETLVRGKRTAAVTGALSVEKAIAILLAGTGLTANSKDGTTFTLAPTPPRSESPNPTGKSTGSPPTSENQNIPNNDSKSSERETAGLSEIVVTGTLIHDVAPITPVTTISHDDMVAQGYTTLAQVIEQLPQNFSGGGTSPSSNPVNGAGGQGATNNLTYSSGVNLRGLGGGATLVLLNGRRMAPAALGGSVDISQIPVSAIDRIEILADGASSLYGSDAVAGVVNIITRKDYSGVEFGGRVTGISEGKTPNYGSDVVGGLSWDGGGFVASFDYQKDNPLFARNRSFSNQLPDPWALSPQDEAAHIYVSLHQQFTDRLTLSVDTLATHRNYEAQNNLYGTQTTYVASGKIEQYAVSPQLDYAISSDWTATLIGQWSKEQDLNTLLRPPQIGASGAIPIDYQVTYLEPRIDGRLFSLPGGAVRVAIGAQVRAEKFNYDTITYGTPAVPEIFINLSRHVESAYGELMVPIIGSDNALRFTRELRVDLSSRYDHYSDFGGTTNPKVGIRWVPVDDIKVHATYARSFQAPTLNDLTSIGNSGIILPVPDPKSPTGSTIALDYIVAGPLQPETAKSFDLGLTYEPSFAPGLKLDASYFSIDFNNEIVNLYSQGICNTCVLQDEAELGSFVQRNPSLAQVNQILNNPTVFVFSEDGAGNFFNGLGPYAPGDIKALANIGLVNAASVRIRGVDLTARYAGIDTRFGRFSADIDASYFADYEQRVTVAAQPFSADNTLFNPLRFRAKANAGWQRKGWAANARVNFANAYTNPQDPNCPSGCPISSWTTVDLGLSYIVPKNVDAVWLSGMRFAVSAANVFNRAPPQVTTSGIGFGYDPVNASPLLRNVSVTFTKRWGAPSPQ